MACKDLVLLEQKGLEVIPAIKLLQNWKKACYSKLFTRPTPQKKR